MGYLRFGVVRVVLLCLIALILPRVTWAKPLQIIHTNDLHSHFEHADDSTRGGYAAVKAKMDELKLEAESQGIDTLILDGGDFSEGSMFFMADDGKRSWQIMTRMGYDAIVVGNHDWLIGTLQMNSILGAIAPSIPFVSANMEFDDAHRALKKHVLPYMELNRAGSRIAVLGLSTDEMVYSWRIRPGGIHDPVHAAKTHLASLRKRNDYVIALTHLGVNKDVELVKKTRGLDLVVGGHSHTLLEKPLYVPSKDRRETPIVQVGKHGEYVGDLLVDVEPGRPMQILRYIAHPILADGPKDPEIDAIVKDSRRMLEEKYTPEWLYEILGYSEVPIEEPKGRPTFWGNLVAETLAETARADLAVDIGQFYGSDQPAGPITRETLMQFYPRVFDLRKPLGWTVWSVHVPGWLLKLVFRKAFEAGHFISSAGLEFEIRKNSRGKTELENFKVNGKRLNPLWNYKVAVTEGLGRGATELSFLLRLFFRPKDTRVPVWTAIENKIRAVGPVIGADRAPASQRH